MFDILVPSARELQQIRRTQASTFILTLLFTVIHNIINPEDEEDFLVFI